MEDAVSTPGPAVSDYSAMDIDFMDNLLLDGCWLETMNGSEFLQNSPPSFSVLLDFPFPLPYNDPDGRMGGSLALPNQARDDTREGPQSDMLVNQGDDMRARWWIPPKANPGPATPVMDRLIQALRHIQDFTKGKDVLIQIWVPVNKGDKCVLTTNKQPFSLDPGSVKLSRYREISENYQFSVEKDSEGLIGLPSRVFLGKVPEWSPDVQFFKSEEYLRLDHAQRLDVRGTLALPIFEQGSRTCLAVIEVVMTTQKINYRPEIETVCKALEAVDLSCSGSCSSHVSELVRKSYDDVLPEIQQVLRSACEVHGLPLAQTWASCIQQGREGCTHSEETYTLCVSTIDEACYVADPSVQGFHEACSEYHLLKGQGAVGQAFLTNQPCFSSDVTSCTKKEYPLSHHAKMVGLRVAVAIRLRSIHEGLADFVLEFFLPSECKSLDEQRRLLGSLSVIIQQTSKSLRVITDKELEDERIDNDSEANGKHLTNCGENDVHERSEEILVEKPLDCGEVRDSVEESVQDRSYWDEASCLKATTTRKGNRKCSKAENAITLDVLRQYFAGSLKDAAKSLGVCPTTLKRICRQRGVKRWPSRKIKKVDHSLQKLQHVIDSVQVAPSSLRIGSFYKEFPDLASPKVTLTRLSNVKPLNQNKPSESASLSCSHGSNSSHGCSSGPRLNPTVVDVNGVEENTVQKEDAGRIQLRRVKSHGELNGTANEAEEAAKSIPRSQSQKFFSPDEESRLPSIKKPAQFAQMEGRSLRIKASYAGEKVRFRLQPHWGLSELWRELIGRFSIEDASKYDLKYLDDDSEWVLLTCDADLAECRDLCRSSCSDTVKLSVEASRHNRRLGSSWGSINSYL
ncbi:hypothetical protein MLD38_034347 [Melastoma candidum]|uniref:Uncharacterized protein n=1 Tax=Melastoma candidum TaxID=119954 RepID=A0ACB9MBZ2_9MYRT|nr:hypothetical protein MLD38_034347 [Melastoma candidum]